MVDRTTLLTLPELAALAAEAVSALSQESGRVREVPDVRTLRYYTTLGLLDRPVELRGRTAYYGERHLRQVVAIKRMQSAGLSLGHIQERLIGISRADLAELAPLPEGLLADRDTSSRSERAGRAHFWRARPPQKTETPAPLENETARPDARDASAPGTPAPRAPLYTLELAPGLLLTLELEAPPSADDQRAIAGAAQHLLRWFQEHRGESAASLSQKESV